MPVRFTRAMARAAWLAPLALGLGACKREPDFDERYAAANASISKTAKEIDAQISGSGVPPGDALLDDDGADKGAADGGI